MGFFMGKIFSLANNLEERDSSQRSSNEEREEEKKEPINSWKRFLKRERNYLILLKGIWKPPLHPTRMKNFLRAVSG